MFLLSKKSKQKLVGAGKKIPQAEFQLYAPIHSHPVRFFRDIWRNFAIFWRKNALVGFDVWITLENITAELWIALYKYISFQHSFHSRRHTIHSIWTCILLLWFSLLLLFCVLNFCILLLFLQIFSFYCNAWHFIFCYWIFSVADVLFFKQKSRMCNMSYLNVEYSECDDNSAL